MKHLKQIVLATSLIMVSAPVFAADAASIAGTYSCTGSNPTDKNYSNDLTIEKADNTYNFKWMNSLGGQYNGMGYLNPNAKDQLVAAFKNAQDPNKSGAIVYQIDADGNLTGSYLRADTQEVGNETCKKTKS